jgi:hypothetical protein
MEEARLNLRRPVRANHGSNAWDKMET